MTVRMTSMFHDSDSLHHHNNSHNQVSPGSTESSPRSSSALIHQAYNWFYDKAELKSTPSILDGIPYDRERRYRNEGARFILNVGSQMKLRYTTLATGVVYFHRFYMFHSFRVFPRYVTAACCLFLAGKAEETPKKCKDIIKIARTQLTDNQFATFGEDPKEEVLTMERIVLQTIRFDLQVDHPYKYLINYAKGFKGNKEKINQILQMAWTFTNDSLSTTICLQWEPEIVAIAMIFLASKIKYEITDWEGRLPSQKHWWDIYVEDLTVEMLEDVCHQVLDLYQKPRDALELKDSPPMSPVQKRLPPAGAQSHALVVRNLQAPPPPPPERPPPPPPSNTTPASAPPHALPLSLPPSAIPIRLLGPAAVVANGAHAAAGALPAPPPPPPPPPIPPLGIGSQWDSFFNHPVIPPFPFPGTNASAGGPPGPPPHLPPGVVPPAPGMHARLPPPPPIALPGTLPRGPPPPLPPTLASFVAGQRNH